VARNMPSCGVHPFIMESSMTDQERNTGDAGVQRAGSGGQDDQEALQQELRRESAEGADSIGDVRENRNLSGSSSWETLIDGERSSGSDSRGEVY
jgi:hypothetical protein